MAQTEEASPPTTTDDTCKLCSEKYSSEKCPKLLPCLHTFCEPCLTERVNAVVEGVSPTCPDCKAVINRSTMIDHVYLLEKLKETKKGDNLNNQTETSPKCTACEEDKDATSFCTECTDWLCEQCVQAHKRVRVTKDHVIEPKDKVQSPVAGSSGPSKERFSNCPLHPQEPLKLYCETCDKLTCRDCQLHEHKEHRYQFVQESSLQSKNLFSVLVSKMKEKKEGIENARNLINQKQEEISSRHSSVVDEIKKTLQNLIFEFNKRVQIMLRDLSLICAAKKGQLNKRNEQVEKLSSRIDHCINFVQTLVDSGSNLSVLHTKSTIVRQATSLLQTRCDVPNPKHVLDIRYSHDTGMFLKNLHHIGLLIVDGVPFKPDAYGAHLPTPPETNGLPQNPAQQTIRNYLQELQKLSTEQRNAVFQRMVQMQRRQSDQGSSIGVTAEQMRGQFNQVQQNQQRQSQQPGVPYGSNVTPHGRPMPPLLPRPPVNNGNHPPPYNQVQNPAYHYMPNVPRPQQHYPSPHQQNQRPHQPYPNPHQQTQSPHQQNQANRLMSPSTAPGSRQWKFHHLQTPPTVTNNRMIAPMPSGNGHPNAEARPGSSNSAPENSESCPSNKSTRPLSADSIKKEKDSGSDGYGGFNSCSFANKENHMSRDGAPGSQSMPMPGPLLTEQVLGDPFEAALRSITEDGLYPDFNNSVGDRPREPIADKQMQMSDPSEDYCACCHNGGELLCCDYCPKVFHFMCHIPPITVAPSGSWRCTLSLNDADIRLEKAESREIVHGQKRKTPVGMSDKELKACERILLELYSHEASTPFHDPVSKSVPEYYKIITNPMDFTTVKCKLSRQHFNHYPTVQSFLSDVKIVFTNCARYNAEPSEVGRAGKSVKMHFEKLVETFLPYYLHFVKEEKPAEANSTPNTDLTVPSASALPSQEDEHSKGAKRRKMDKTSVIHYT